MDGNRRESIFILALIEVLEEFTIVYECSLIPQGCNVIVDLKFPQVIEKGMCFTAVRVYK